MSCEGFKPGPGTKHEIRLHGVQFYGTGGELEPGM
jgi:hypothetical protein